VEIDDGHGGKVDEDVTVSRLPGVSIETAERFITLAAGRSDGSGSLKVIIPEGVVTLPLFA
jgi:hypothetical protein